MTEFPSELILLGRATVMIKGIANRLGVKWGLSDRWAVYAKETLALSEPSEYLPIWSVATPAVSTVATAAVAGAAVRPGSRGRVRFTDVVTALKGWVVLVKVRSDTFDVLE